MPHSTEAYGTHGLYIVVAEPLAAGGQLINDNTKATSVALDAVALSLASKADASTLSSHTGNTSNPHSVTAAQVGAYTTGAVDTLLAAKASAATLAAHTSNTSNPHSVTAAQVGAYTTGAVDTALAAKADASALTSHTGNTSNPHSVTAAQVGAYTSGAVDTLLAGKASLAFPTIAITGTAGQSNVVAELVADTLTLHAGSNVVINSTPASDTIAFAVSSTPTFTTLDVTGLTLVGQLYTTDTLTIGANIALAASIDIDLSAANSTLFGDIYASNTVVDGLLTATTVVAGVVALTDGATINTNARIGNTFTVTLGGNRTMAAPSNPLDGQKIVYRIKQDGTGSRTLTWNSAFRFSGGSAPTLTTTAGKTDYIGFVYNGADSKWDCVAERLNF